MSKQAKSKNKLASWITLFLCCAVVVGLIFAAPWLMELFGGKLPDGGEGSLGQAPEEPEYPIELTISCVGDIMVHSPQIPAQYNMQTGGYDFHNNFEYIKPYIEKADLALCNLETTFAGGPGYSGYPLFNTPDELADAVKASGWDVAILSNNHILDKGLDGMKRTITVAREKGLQTVGAQLEGEKNYTIVNVKGVNIGIVAYTYETARQNGRRALNGNPIPVAAEPLLNTFGYGYLDEDLNKIFGSISQARNDGAEIILCYFHWGQEYQGQPTEYDRRIAREVAAAGADIIFASHPHVIQPIEYVEVEATGKRVPIFYSLGNFISNQRLETVNDRFTEQGILGQVTLEFMKSTGEIINMNPGAVPFWVEKYWTDRNIYTVIPLDSNLSTNPVLPASGHLWKAEQAKQDIINRIGEEFIIAD